MIGIFDSGVGGMTVARAIEQLCPDYPLIYFGDIARTPYGSKSPETIQRYAVNNTKFLVDQGAELIVIACNSAASTALPTLNDQFDLPIEKRRLASVLGMTPENLSRAIKSLQPYGVIIDGQTISITNLDDLKGLAKPTPLIDDPRS